MRTLTVTLLLLAMLASAASSGVRGDEPTTAMKPLFRDFMGINGHTVSFKPELYSPVCRLVRDYHPMDWDTGSESNYKLDFPFAKNRVNWQSVYGSWQKSGFETDACIMFETIPPEGWKNRSHDSQRYGKLFAENFGPSGTYPLVEAVEIGNEPGKYSDEAYRDVFKNMATGLREGDPKIRIATCNVNNAESGDYHKSVKTVEGLESLYDILNVHTYAMLEQWPTWKRSYPEDPNLIAFTRDVDELIRWRDEKAAGKEIWLTEFGWDSSTKKPSSEGDFAKWQGNSDLEQAQWLVRSFFLFATRDVDRAYIYFFNDDDAPQLHGSSGLTRGFQPKPSYHAVSHLYRTLGDYRFSRVVQDVAAEVRVYEFAHESNANDVVWVGWCPTGHSHQATARLPMGDWKMVRAEQMPLGPQAAKAVDVPNNDGNLEWNLTESPTYLFLRRN